MATHINNQTINSQYGSPLISYDVTYTAKRSGYDVTYTFTIKTYLEAYGVFGSGYGLKCEITVGDKTASTTIKTTSDIWNNGSSGTKKIVATDTITVTCQSAKSNQNQTVDFVVTRTDSAGGNSGKVDTSSYYVTSPALATYTVSYNANGGSGAPAKQTKTYGTDLTLSSVIPTKNGYSFEGWATSQNGSVVYAAGATYKTNANVTLYAVWKIAYNCHINVDGTMKRGLMWIKDSGVWKKGIPWIKTGDEWQQGG